jgi:glutathione S-transferase
MGGCYSNQDSQTLVNQKVVDRGDWFKLPDVAYPEPENSRQEALYRVIKHHHNIIRVNPLADHVFDEALRCALTYMITGEDCLPPSDSDLGLRYLCDRISIPRDMSIYAGKRLRHALEYTASLVGDRQPEALPLKHRLDQNPANFGK